LATYLATYLLSYILGTEAGGKAFALFVDETGVFLKPLPPRPDPP
jgi:hypothetical protein